MLRSTYRFLSIIVLSILCLAFSNANAAYSTKDGIELEGVIQSIGTNNNGIDTVVVKNVVFYVDSSTAIKNENDNKILSFSDLKVGAYIEISGNKLSDGVYTAQKISLKGQSDLRIELEGVIQNIGSDNNGKDSLVINNLVFYVVSETQIRSREKPITFTELKIGDSIELKGIKTSEGKLIARYILRKDGGIIHELDIQGYIDSLGTNFILVARHMFFINEQTQIKGEEDKQLALNDLSVGIFAKVEAYGNMNDTLWAKKIEVKNRAEKEIELEGRIDSVYSNSFKIGRIEFSVDSSTIIVGDNSSVYSFSDIKTGMRVEIKAKRLAERFFHAIEIKIEDNNVEKFEITGAIKSIDGSIIDVAGSNILTDNKTIIIGNHRQPIALSSLKIGMIIHVKGYRTNDGSMYAVKIKAEDFWRHKIEISGTIDSLGTNWLNVMHKRILIDSNTVIIDTSRNQISFSNLSLGMRVEIKALRNLDRSLTALKIRISHSEATEINVEGTIDTLSSSWLYANGLRFNIDSNTVVQNQFDSSITFTDLTLGMYVDVKAVKKTDNSLLAIVIQIEEDPNISVINGSITGVTNNDFSVSQPSFTITQSTVVLDSLYQPVSSSSLSLGTNVTVWADYSAPSTPTALQVQIVSSQSITAINGNENKSIPSSYILNQNYPNPFNPSTIISYQLSAKSKVSIKIFDILGNEVTTLVNAEQSPGTYKVIFNGSGLSSGIYFYRFQANNFSESKKMILLK